MQYLDRMDRALTRIANSVIELAELEAGPEPLESIADRLQSEVEGWRNMPVAEETDAARTDRPMSEEASVMTNTNVPQYAPDNTWLEVEGDGIAEAIAGRTMQTLRAIATLACNGHLGDTSDPRNYERLFNLMFGLTKAGEVLACIPGGGIGWFLYSLELLADGADVGPREWIQLPAGRLQVMMPAPPPPAKA